MQGYRACEALLQFIVVQEGCWKGAGGRTPIRAGEALLQFVVVKAGGLQGCRW